MTMGHICRMAKSYHGTFNGAWIDVPYTILTVRTTKTLQEGIEGKRVTRGER